MEGTFFALIRTAAYSCLNYVQVKNWFWVNNKKKSVRADRFVSTACQPCPSCYYDWLPPTPAPTQAPTRLPTPNPTPVKPTLPPFPKERGDDAREHWDEHSKSHEVACNNIVLAAGADHVQVNLRPSAYGVYELMNINFGSHPVWKREAVASKKDFSWASPPYYMFYQVSGNEDT